MVPQKNGFTLVELLVVIAIIGILVAMIVTTLDPVTRSKQARDAVRQNDVLEILSAVQEYQQENTGSGLSVVASMNAGDVYMIVNGAMKAGCDDNNAVCETAVTDDSHCVDLSQLVADGFLDALPVSPAGAVAWDRGVTTGTGYTLEQDSTGVLSVRSCESEEVEEISASR